MIFLNNLNFDTIDWLSNSPYFNLIENIRSILNDILFEIERPVEIDYIQSLKPVV